MSGTDTALAELTEPAAILSAARRHILSAARRDPLPGRRRCPRRHRLVRRRVRRRRCRRPGRDGRRPHRTRRAGDRRRCALPGRRVPRNRPESPVAAAGFGEPDAVGADTDETLERARAHGAHVQREPYENYGARNAAIVDPFGHRWMLTGPTTGAPTPIQHGDVGYVSVWTPDAERAAAFYGHVLGWTYDPRDPAGHQHRPAHRHLLRRRSAHLVLLLRGGRPGRCTREHSQRRRNRRTRSSSSTSAPCSAPPTRRASSSRCSSRLPASRARNSTAAGPVNCPTSPTRCRIRLPSRPSTVGLLFWTFEPGRIDDGWQVSRTHPMAGVAGGNAAAGDRARCGRSTTSTPPWRGCARPAGR